ncbi:MAG: hypothetical protein PVH12_00430 [Candidatus Bathyarchaeota archaeon]|jgi:hypothetical protein
MQYIKQFMQRNIMWVTIAVFLVATVVTSFMILVVYSANIRAEAWAITTEYDEDSSSPHPLSSFKAIVKVAIYNHGTFSTILRDASVRVFINGIDMGTIHFLNEGHIIPPQTWCVWDVTFNATGKTADLLGSNSNYLVYLVAHGVASCMLYSTSFESMHKRTF